MLHDPWEELPGGKGFSILNFLKFFGGKADHAWTNRGQVIWWFYGESHNFGKLVFNDLVKVDKAPSVMVMESLGLAANTSTARTNY